MKTYEQDLIRQKKFDLSADVERRTWVPLRIKHYAQKDDQLVEPLSILVPQKFPDRSVLQLSWRSLMRGCVARNYLKPILSRSVRYAEVVER